MIRALTPQDSDIYKKLRLLSLQTDPLAFLSTFEIESSYPPFYFRQKIASSLKAPAYGVYGFFDENTLQATAQLADSYYHNKRHIAFLNEVYVNPEYRRKGIATKLVNYLIAKAKENPALEQLHLRANSGNRGAISFYEKLGFKRIAVLKDAVKNSDNSYQDEHFYSLELKTKAVE